MYIVPTLVSGVLLTGTEARLAEEFERAIRTRCSRFRDGGGHGTKEKREAETEEPWDDGSYISLSLEDQIKDRPQTERCIWTAD